MNRIDVYHHLANDSGNAVLIKLVNEMTAVLRNQIVTTGAQIMTVFSEFSTEAKLALTTILTHTAGVAADLQDLIGKVTDLETRVASPDDLAALNEVKNGLVAAASGLQALDQSYPPAAPTPEPEPTPV